MCTLCERVCVCFSERKTKRKNVIIMKTKRKKGFSLLRRCDTYIKACLTLFSAFYWTIHGTGGCSYLGLLRRMHIIPWCCWCCCCCCFFSYTQKKKKLKLWISMFTAHFLVSILFVISLWMRLTRYTSFISFSFAHLIITMRIQPPFSLNLRSVGVAQEKESHEYAMPWANVRLVNWSKNPWVFVSKYIENIMGSCKEMLLSKINIPKESRIK